MSESQDREYEIGKIYLIDINKLMPNPEQPRKYFDEDEIKVPTKDWSKHGLEYAAKTAIHAEYAERERELQERNDISASGKKELQAFLRMEQVAAEARAEGSPLGEVKRRIDGKGVVIFTLESGGTIRDTGKEIFFSTRDPKAEHTATSYAEKKWGRHVTLGKGCIAFQLERDVERQAPEIQRKEKGISR